MSEIEQELYESALESRFDLKKFLHKIGKGVCISTALLLAFSLYSCDDKKSATNSEKSLIEHILDRNDEVHYDNPWLEYYTTATQEITELRIAWDEDPDTRIDEFPTELQVHALSLVADMGMPFYSQKTIDIEKYCSLALKALNVAVDMFHEYKQVFDKQMAETSFCVYEVTFDDRFDNLGIAYNSHTPILDIYNQVLNALTVVTQSIRHNESDDFLLVHLQGLRKIANNAGTLTSLKIPYSSQVPKKEVEIPHSLLDHFAGVAKEFQDLYESMYPVNSTLYGPTVSLKSLNRKLNALERVVLNHIAFLQRKQEGTYGNVTVLSGNLPFYEEWLNNTLDLENMPQTFSHTLGASLEIRTQDRVQNALMPPGTVYYLRHISEVKGKSQIYYVCKPVNEVEQYCIYIYDDPALYSIRQGFNASFVDDTDKTPDDLLMWGIQDENRSGEF